MFIKLTNASYNGDIPFPTVLVNVVQIKVVVPIPDEEGRCRVHLVGGDHITPDDTYEELGLMLEMMTDG